MQFIELFAGAGGMSLGLEAAGMEHLLSFEKEAAPHSVLVHSGKLALRMDLADVGNAVIAMRQVPDLIAGGPPCQDFSVQGNQVEGENARLTRHFAQIICLQRPEWFLFENVTKAAKSREYHIARALWKRHGYGLTEVVINASEYGVPQIRERFFCIGRLHEIDGFLEAEIKAAKSPRPMTVREILNPKEYADDRELLEKGYYFVQPWRGRKGEPNSRGVLSLDEPCFTISRHTRDKPSSSYIPHADDAGPVEQAPLLTSSQVARIQGFASDYDFRRKAFRYAREGWPADVVDLMIANAVPAPMAERIGRVIFDRHYGISIPALGKDFTDYIRKDDTKRKKPMTDAAVYNVRSSVNRARNMVGGRVYANLALELQALESSHEVTWHDRERRRSEVGKRFSEMGVRMKSDLRAALELYHAYIVETRQPSKWAPEKSATLPDFKKPPKKRSRKPKGSALSHGVPRPVIERRGPLNLNAGQQDPEEARLQAMFVSDGWIYDPYAPQPALRDDEWRPNEYADPLEDPNYLEFLDSTEPED